MTYKNGNCLTRWRETLGKESEKISAPLPLETISQIFFSNIVHTTDENRNSFSVRQPPGWLGPRQQTLWFCLLKIFASRQLSSKIKEKNVGVHTVCLCVHAFDMCETQQCAWKSERSSVEPIVFEVCYGGYMAGILQLSKLFVLQTWWILHVFGEKPLKFP